MAKSKALLDLLTVWEETRWNSTEFIKSLGDEGLKKALPRPGLNTFCKHFQEMIDAQEVYVMAIEEGEMKFDAMMAMEDYSGEESAKNLLKRMEELDIKLVEAVKQATDDLMINWPDGEQSLVYTLSNLCVHEILHIGQLVAFCYPTRVPLPESIVESWFLSPQEDV